MMIKIWTRGKTVNGRTKNVTILEIATLAQLIARGNEKIRDVFNKEYAEALRNCTKKEEQK